MKELKERLSLSLPPDLIKWLKATAKSQVRPVSNMAEYIFVKHREQEEKNRPDRMEGNRHD